MALGNMIPDLRVDFFYFGSRIQGSKRPRKDPQNCLNLCQNKVSVNGLRIFVWKITRSTRIDIGILCNRRLWHVCSREREGDIFPQFPWLSSFYSPRDVSFLFAPFSPVASPGFLASERVYRTGTSTQIPYWYPLSFLQYQYQGTWWY